MARRLLLLLLLATLVAACDRGPQWNVVVVTFDTTRADHLGPYGHDGVETPTLDQLAAEGVLFEHAYTPIPITLPAHSSLMTGKVPFAHGVRDNALFTLGDEQTTLAEILRSEGYRTAAAIGAFPLLGEFGIGQGFELFDDYLSAGYEDIFGERVFPKSRLFFDERPAARVNEAVLPWLEENHQDPFMLWVHYFDPHHPLEPPAPYNQLYAHDPYLGEIAYADESLGTLLDHLRRLGVYDRTLVVFTSDHGEGRGDHKETTHSLLLYDSTLHVPLIVKPAGEAAAPGRRIQRRVGIIDVLPTVLELLGIEPPKDIQGRSLAAEIGAEHEVPRGPRRELYGETLSPRFSRNWGELRALIVENFKYVHGPRPELYDLAADPQELHNLIDQDTATATGLRQRLEHYLAEHSVAGLDSSVAVDEATVRRLQALGYLQASGGPVGPIEERLRDDGEAPQDHVDTISEYSHAKDLLFRDQVPEAKDLLLNLLRRDPDNPHYLEMLASAELRLGRHDEALLVLERIEALDAGYPPPEQILGTAGRVLLAQGKIGEALDKLRRAQSLAETAQGQYQLAKIYQLMGRTDDERTHLDRSLELDPTFVAARIDVAIRKAGEGDLEAAEADFSRALADNPYHERAFYNYGSFLIQAERPQDAVPYFRRAAELKGDYLQAHYALFALLYELGDWDEATKSFETLHQLAPGSLEAQRARDLMGIGSES
ncbi:MAG: sulfatase-like hydrolase/transferase [Acidobacteriota bacterium]